VRRKLADSEGYNVVSKEELVHLDGEVILIAKGGFFRIKLDNGHEVLAKLAGKVRRHRIRVVLGDRVTVAVSVYDPTQGFIVYRQR
jgi:translation initiation factor IF-1